MMPRKFRIDSDALLSEFLLDLLLTGYIAVIYAIVYMSTGGPSGGEQLFTPPLWVNIATISIVAITLLPVRRWLHGRVHLMVYGQHDDPYLLIWKVNNQLQSPASPQLTMPAVAETLVSTLKLPYVAIETDVGQPLRIETGSRPEPVDLISFPLMYLDRLLGTLRVGARRAHESLSNADIDLLTEVGRQIGIALHAAQLSADLQASREKIVLAREEERRRIRNDLHDGLAPTLSSLQMQLGAVRNLIKKDPEHAERLANEMREDLRRATADIRRLVYDLRPPMLDELGLVGAIRNFRLEGSTLQLEVVAPEPMPKLPAAVEVAVYRIASEAIHNVIKHADACRCQVSLEIDGSYLKLTIRDDGHGLPLSADPGVGKQSMQERAAELGGTFFIQNCEEEGTCVVAQFPLNL